jgi:hypothetical protein
MAEEQSGSGEFNASGDFREFLNRAVEVLGRVDVGQATLDTRLSSVEAELSSVVTGQKSLRAAFSDELGKTRTDIMGKVADLQKEVATIREDIAVEMGAVDMAREVNDNTRNDVKQMREQLSVMWKQLKRAQDDIRELKGDP